MPIIKKLVKLGDSYFVCLPKGWITYWKKGKPIGNVEMEINQEIRIRPALNP